MKSILKDCVAWDCYNWSRAILTPIIPHVCRHTLCNNMAIQYLMGHFE